MNNSVIIPEEQFRPFLFLDLPAKVVAVGAVSVGRQVKQEYEDGKKKFTHNILSGFEHISLSSQSVNQLLKSIDNIHV